MNKLLAALLALSVCCLKFEQVYTGAPDGLLWGNPDYISYDADRHEFINDNYAIERIFQLMDRDLGYHHHTLPEHVPEHKEIVFKIDPALMRRRDPTFFAPLALLCTVQPVNRRFVLVNSEHTVNENEAAKGRIEYRLWPHLGLLYIGTVADQEGWEVILHDELIEGYANLEHLVQPGDLVGLSLVATGTERGVELARQAKNLGARHVIAGNDTAIFRANQILRLPDHPIDAVFTTNSLGAVRTFLREIPRSPLNALMIPGVAVAPAVADLSNETASLRAQRNARHTLQRNRQFDPQDVFIVPQFELYSRQYWDRVWDNYRATFGHKHDAPTNLRNALALFAQGCTRTRSTDVCSYCTIAGVGDIRVPTMAHLADLLAAYERFGINYVYNVTDSVFEMRSVVGMLGKLGAHFSEGLMIYARAYGLAHYPELISAWMALTGGRLLLDVGMDSGDEKILERGVGKASREGSRIVENRQAIRNIREHGGHLHYSLVFGSPGETRESCERTLEFFEWTRATLGTQLDQCEADIFWLNHGSPAARVLHDYAYAQELAALAGKPLALNTWEQRFHRYRDTLTVPWGCEVAWYEHFTNITVEYAQALAAHVAHVMQLHHQAAPGRRNAFKPG